MTTGFDTVVNKSPEYEVRIFNKSYKPEDAYSHLDADAAVIDSGWYQIPSSAIGMLKLKIDDSIYKKSTADFEILQDELWMYTLDTIGKREASVYHPVSADQQPDASGSRLIIQIDDDGYGSPDTTGTVSITGTVDSVADTTEVVTIAGNGSYSTTNAFETVNASGVTSSGLSCHVAIFGNVGNPNTVHEMKISCDTNGNGNFGLMFGGYMSPVTNKVRTGQTTVTLRCVDYTDFLMSNEYISGNRAEYVCISYDNSVNAGDCSNASAEAVSHWYLTSSHTDANKMCYIGDMNTHHPGGTAVADGDYICASYSASLTPLPYSGYTDKTGYAPDGEGEYAFIPQTFTLFMNAIKRMSRSLDYGITSRPFDMAIKGQCLAAEAIDDSETGIDYDNDIGTIATNDLIQIDNEWMLVSSNIASVLTVTRAKQLTTAAAHDDNSTITAYHCANVTYGSSALDNFREANVKSDIYKTGTSCADIMTSISSDALFVFWVDKFKQLQITELYLTNPGASGGGSSTDFIIVADDVVKVDSIIKGGVVNKVSAWVTLSASQSVYCEIDTDRLESDAEIGDANYNTSISLFGLRSEELKNSQLNSVSIDSTDYSGFKTYAYNYLKSHAYPKITQSITVDSFIPDEHYWSDADEPPYFLYTDEYNSHICLLGRKVTAPDYSLEDAPAKTFIVESIHYNITKRGNFDTKITMSRISAKGDY